MKRPERKKAGAELAKQGLPLRLRICISFAIVISQYIERVVFVVNQYRC